MAPIDRAGSRSSLRTVALPSEHGGWGLTAEPVLLGLLLAPSVAGLLLGLAGFGAFLLRTPLKLVLVDASRRRSLDRTVQARRLASIELLVVLSLVVGAVLTTSRPFWIPVLIAVPFVAVELWFDMRSRSRRLVPELAGSIGIASLAAAIAIAGGATLAVAFGAWMVLSARALTSIPFVRGRIAMLHGRSVAAWSLVMWDVLAMLLAAAATAVDRPLVAGSVAVIVVVAAQRVSARRPAPRAVVIGVQQTVLGFAVVMVTWLGVLATGGAT